VTELCEFNALSPVLRLEPTTCKMVNIVPLPVAGAEECLYMTPRGLDGVRVSSSTLINKASAVTDHAVRVTFASRSRYAAQQSLMTVVPGSIHASITAFIVSAVL
jgi:hypothetical protein